MAKGVTPQAKGRMKKYQEDKKKVPSASNPSNKIYTWQQGRGSVNPATKLLTPAGRRKANTN
jgi:hypothetical protein